MYCRQHQTSSLLQCILGFISFLLIHWSIFRTYFWDQHQKCPLSAALCWRLLFGDFLGLIYGKLIFWKQKNFNVSIHACLSIHNENKYIYIYIFKFFLLTILLYSNYNISLKLFFLKSTLEIKSWKIPKKKHSLALR